MVRAGSMFLHASMKKWGGWIAIWHLLTAATTVILFFYLATEIGAR
jgi:hypothetical protein